MDDDIQVSQDNISLTSYIQNMDGKFPKLYVNFICEHLYSQGEDKVQCIGHARLDVYKGPPKCHGTREKPHEGKWMKPMTVLFPNAKE